MEADSGRGLKANNVVAIPSVLIRQVEAGLAAKGLEAFSEAWLIVNYDVTSACDIKETVALQRWAEEMQVVIGGLDEQNVL